MPKNAKVIDYKPTNNEVVDYKPKSQEVINFKPKIGSALNSLETNRLYPSTLGRGMLVGFGPHITYPESIDIVSPIQT